MKLYTILEPFYDVSFENIKTAAKMLRIPLDEKVTIINEDTGEKIVTDRAVPVGCDTFLSEKLKHNKFYYRTIILKN